MTTRHLSVAIVAAALINAPAPAPAFAADPHGLFLNGGQSGVAQQALDHPDVAGMLIQAEWGSIEMTQGSFDWGVVDQRVLQAADSGKQVRLALHAGGDGVPDWIVGMLDVNGGDIVSIQATKNGETITIPSFWDPTFLGFKKAFYREMASRFGSHPNVAALSVSIADPFTGDWAFHSVEPETAAAAGYDSVDFAGKWRDLVKEVMIAAPGKMVATAVGSTPRQLILLVNPGEDKFFAFDTAMSLMEIDPAIDMSRLAGGKGSLHAATPDPADPDLQIPDDLREWEAVYQIINTYGANGFGQFVWSVTNDPEFKMNGGDPYGGPGEATAAEVFFNAAQIGDNYGVQWIETWEIDILNTAEPDLQAAIADAAAMFAEPASDCPADITGDGVLDLADVGAFVAAFVNQQPPADLNGDGVYDLADLQAFIDAFVSGCAL